MPRLSIVVPVYNPTPEVFEAHLRSINDQSLTDWEAIYVLDGPQPTVKDAITRLLNSSEARYLPFREKTTFIEIEHGGAPAARNAGRVLAKSALIVFFDADCILEPLTSKTWVSMFDKHPEAGFIYAGYKFLKEGGAVPSLPWDEYMLTTRNYISGCFPVRKHLCPEWDTSLLSLQDWDFWLSVVENARKSRMDISKLGRYMEGYAFKTEAPKEGSISAEGCKHDVWLSRMDAVKKKHGIADRSICVASLSDYIDGIRLAKSIAADFLPDPADKPHRYKHMIQVGYSLGNRQNAHARIFDVCGPNVKKSIFWTPKDIQEIWTGVNLQTLHAYKSILNGTVNQYVEDKRAKDLMKDAGFDVTILPLPISCMPNVPSQPHKPRILFDFFPQYKESIDAVRSALPDIETEVLCDGTMKSLRDYSAVVHFYPDRCLTSLVKRAHIAGRHVVSNIKSPFCGYVNDDDPEMFIREVVDKVRKSVIAGIRTEAAKYYAGLSSPERVKELLA